MRPRPKDPHDISHLNYVGDKFIPSNIRNKLLLLSNFQGEVKLFPNNITFFFHSNAK